ncbi:hypothetical protein COX27_00570 [Candidatus Kuenenbacteria bacterium CG23_combo_of_CG06-09_8_20_14_all_36_9]|nr:MAG: hypothetical protein COX27_00570 [Candidatus Kuenenbacteria bacterium CG23_combo_of_CG06-09_8_20_14_all_36_9]
MLVFLDDSGDPGFKLDQGSTSHFVIAMVCFDDELEAEKTAIAIKELKRELKFSEQKRAQKGPFPTTSLCPMSGPRHHPVTVQDTGFCNFSIAYYFKSCQIKLSTAQIGRFFICPLLFKEGRHDEVVTGVVIMGRRLFLVNISRLKKSSANYE